MAEGIYEGRIKDISEMLKRFPIETSRQKEKLFKFMDTKDENGCNLLLQTIQEQMYDDAKNIVETLKHLTENDYALTILEAHDNKEDNCFHLLIKNLKEAAAPRVDLTHQTSKTPKNAEDLFDQLVNSKLLSVRKLATELNQDNFTPIFLAAKFKLGDRAKRLLEKCDFPIQIDQIKSRETCTSKCVGHKHHKACEVDCNLLMIAIKNSRQQSMRDLVMYIIEIVTKIEDQDIKINILLGQDEVKCYRSDDSCFMLAAKNDDPDFSILQKLGECVPEYFIKSLLQVKLPSFSVLGYIIQCSDPVENMKKILPKEPSEVVQHFTGNKKEHIERSELNKTLSDIAWKNNFLQLPMTRAVIKFFSADLKLVEEEYLIPNLCRSLPNTKQENSNLEERSRPIALVCHETNNGELTDVEKEVMCIKGALSNLEWDSDDIETFGPTWSCEDLIDEIEKLINKVWRYCSLFVLYVTSHGTSGRIHGSGKPGAINAVLDAVSDDRLEGIPKVVILDMCRREVEGEEPELTVMQKDLCVLSSSVHQGFAPQLAYASALKDAIESTGGGAALRDLHDKACRQISGYVPVRTSKISQATDEGPTQIPHVYRTTDKRIILRKLKESADALACNYCRNHVANSDFIQCPGCEDFYHLACISKDDTRRPLPFIPGTHWRCTSCYPPPMEEEEQDQLLADLPELPADDFE